MAFDTAAVQQWLKVGNTDGEIFDVIVAAVVSFVDACPDRHTLPPADPDAPEDPPVWAMDTHLAGLMLAGRLYRRRNSPSGVEAFTGDGATYVSRNDPDVARLLRIEGYAPPRVG